VDVLGKFMKESVLDVVTNRYRSILARAT